MNSRTRGPANGSTLRAMREPTQDSDAPSANSITMNSADVRSWRA
ncbi:UNVERIFIED_CONTAM: hypothetical protein RKD43_002954 [Streptomyces graminofaciens]